MVDVFICIQDVFSNLHQNCSLILKFHLFIPGLTNKISTENRQSKLVYTYSGCLDTYVRSSISLYTRMSETYKCTEVKFEVLVRVGMTQEAVSMIVALAKSEPLLAITGIHIYLYMCIYMCTYMYLNLYMYV